MFSCLVCQEFTHLIAVRGVTDLISGCSKEFYFVFLILLLCIFIFSLHFFYISNPRLIWKTCIAFVMFQIHVRHNTFLHTLPAWVAQGTHLIIALFYYTSQSTRNINLTFKNATKLKHID